MTRREAYADGYADGERWAEKDARDGLRVDPGPSQGSELARTYALGAMRGYAQTWERIHAGTLTPEMFEASR
jgi:hypothetical protein